MGSLTHALLTMRKIDAMIEEDGGARFRGWLGRVLPHIGDAYSTEPDGHRSHMGASVLGTECARAVWYGFRWVTKSSFAGRLLRLFNRGHLEEGRIIAQLLMIGAQVIQQDANGNQFRISWAQGHAGGSGDGVVIDIPDLPPGLPALLEAKTSSEKLFIELAGKLVDWRKYVAGEGPFTGQGVKVAKPEHYIQMQLYMRRMGLTCALYVCVCKNTDDEYMELVTLDAEMADQYIDRGDTLVWLDKAPKKINESAGFFKCRFCDHRPACHLGAPVDINCRTCDSATPIANGAGGWYCSRHNMELTKPKQRVGCPDWHELRGLR